MKHQSRSTIKHSKEFYMNYDLSNTRTYADILADTQYIDEEKLEYEIIFGNEKIVFIKAGAGVSVCGYKNKYIRMARQVHERIGATVICASNPEAPHEELDEAKIRWVIDEMGLSNFEIYFIGTSDGAYHNLSLARRFSETVKWIGINTSYIDISDLEERLMALSSIYKVLIHGTEDDDFNEIVPIISKMECNKIEIKIVDGADHSFTGMVEEFIALADEI
jgi:hypothetical protein